MSDEISNVVETEMKNLARIRDAKLDYLMELASDTKPTLIGMMVLSFIVFLMHEVFGVRNMLCSLDGGGCLSITATGFAVIFAAILWFWLLLKVSHDCMRLDEKIMELYEREFFGG